MWETTASNDIMGITITAADEEQKTSLELILRPGLPVCIESVPRDLGDDETASRFLFITDGNVTMRDNALWIGNHPGRHMSGYVSIDNSNMNYVLVPTSTVLPLADLFTTEAPVPLPDHTQVNSRTSRIITGNQLTKEYAEAVRAARFMHDAHHLHLDSVYSLPLRLVTNSISDRMPDNEQLKKSRELCKIIGVGAVRTLVEREMHSLGNKRDVTAVSLANFPALVDDYRNGGYSVSGVDSALVYGGDIIGFVRAGMGRSFGDVFALPTRDFAPLFVNALASDAVRAFFPYKAK